MTKKNKKEEMGYNPSPIQKKCMNCIYFSSDLIENQYGYVEEKNIKCVLGGFVVKKLGNCNLHEFKVA